MSDSVDSDVLMYMAQTAGSPMAAESTSELNADDTLTSDFVAGKYFEIEDFTLQMNLSDDEGDGAADNAKETRPYGRWRGLADDSDTPDPPFRADPDDVSFSRLIDSASPVLLKNCLDKKRFDTAVIVKRSRMGSAAQMSTILRLEFQQVFVRAVQWEDGNTVRESCKFKFGLMKATYRKRNQDSSIASSSSCSWASNTMTKSNFRV